jgi:GT2 family glycosyltransferase
MGIGERAMSAHAETDVSVSVVIPTWQRKELLRRCLGGVLSQERQPDEVVVVGRATDLEARGVVEMARSSSATHVRWVEVTEPGHVPPVRHGLESVHSELVAFLDDDAVPERDWLEAIIAPLRDQTVVCVGGRVRTPGFSGVVHRDAGRVRWYGKYVGNIGALERPGLVRVDAVMEGNWCWRTSVLRSLAFDPVLAQDDASMYGLDLCLQAKALGGEIVYTSAARVLHTPGPRSDGSIDRDDEGLVRLSYSRNYTYIALSRFRGRRLLAFFVWWWLVGERASYGLGTAIVDGMNGKLTIDKAMSSFKGKSDGVLAWRGRSHA